MGAWDVLAREVVSVCAAQSGTRVKSGNNMSPAVRQWHFGSAANGFQKAEKNDFEH